MIYLGRTDTEKQAIIDDYQAAHNIAHVVIISANKFALCRNGADCVPYSEVIMYRTFYRLLQEIDTGTLVVVNECLRNQNRYDLSYNCIRQFLNQAGHVLVFQQLPQIDTAEDFMILFDFVTQSRWKRRSFDPALITDNAQVNVQVLPVAFRRIDVPTSVKTAQVYEQERARRFATLGPADPHTLPRNLYLVGGKDKAAYISRQSAPSLFDTGDAALYVARNKRLGLPNVVTYDEVQPGARYDIVELPHAFADYADFVRTTWQAEAAVLCATLRVDAWYFNRYTEWSERTHETYASLR